MTSTIVSHTVPRNYWSAIARRWELVGEPLRPGEQDLRYFAEGLRLAGSLLRPLRAAILGVTPELYHLPWPQGAMVSAIDLAQDMIDSVWPGPRASAYCGDWTNMPFESASLDIVLCDGGPIMLKYPEGLSRLAHEIHRVLTPSGICVIRTFVQGAYRETADKVLEELLCGNVSNTNVLKLRLGMALQEDACRGVALSTIWNRLHEAAPDLDHLAAQIGFDPEQLQAINAYRDCSNRYSFHTLNEFLRPFVKSLGGFTVESIHTPNYVLGDRCPTVLLRRDAEPHFENAVDVPASIVRSPHFPDISSRHE